MSTKLLRNSKLPYLPPLLSIAHHVEQYNRNSFILQALYLIHAGEISIIQNHSSYVHISKTCNPHLFHLCIETLLRLWFWPRLFSWYDIQCFCNFLSKIFPLHCALSKNVNFSRFCYLCSLKLFWGCDFDPKDFSRVFLRRQIWIVNYYVKNPIKNSQ